MKPTLTPLQKTLLKADGLRRITREMLIKETGAPIKGYYKLWREVITEAVLSKLTDNEARTLLYDAMESEELTEKEKLQIEILLGLK